MGFKMKPSPFKNLRRWFEEEWETPRCNKDYSKGENTFRPTRRVSRDTPTTWSELTPAEKASRNDKYTTIFANFANVVYVRGFETIGQ